MCRNSMRFFRGQSSKTTVIALLLLSCITLGNGEFRLQIVHNSDVHARFEQTDANYGVCSEQEEKEGKCFGGFPRTKTAIEMAREEAKPEQIPTIVVNAGDFFVGTAYYDLRKWGLTAPMVQALNYDVITIGNHDFDDGIQNLVDFINHVGVPVVCCNLDLTTDRRLDIPNLTRSHILDVEGTKIGVIGFVTPSTMEFSRTENLIILPEIPEIQLEVKNLKAQNVDIIIALSHSGFEDDIEIAKEVPELSLIIGGHTHLLLYTPESKRTKRRRTSKDDAGSPIIDILDKEKVSGDYPHNVELASGKIIPIVHSHAYTKYLGKLIVTFDNDGNVTSTAGNTMILDSTIPEDEDTKNLLESLIGPLRPLVKAPIAYTRIPLTPTKFSELQFESTLGNLVADALISYAARKAYNSGMKEWTTSSIAMVNGASFFQELGYDGRVSLEDVRSVFMAGNNVVEVLYPGWVLRDAIEYSLIPEPDTYNFYHFLHVSGLRVVCDLSKPTGQRIESIKALCADCTIPRYENLDTNRNYKVIIPVFLWHGNHGFHMLRSNLNEPERVKGLTVGGIVRTYIDKMKIVYPMWDGRITVKNAGSISIRMEDVEE